LSYSHRRNFIIAIGEEERRRPRLRMRLTKPRVDAGNPPASDPNSRRGGWTPPRQPAGGRRYTRPMPTYSNPRARRRVESSRFFVSTITGFFSRCLMRSKSSARNSGHPVPTTSASEPSAAA